MRTGTIKHCFALFTPAKCSQKYTSLFLKWNVSQCTLKHRLLTWLLQEQREKRASSDQETLHCIHLAILIHSSLYCSLNIGTKGDRIVYAEHHSKLHSLHWLFCRSTRFKTLGSDKNTADPTCSVAEVQLQNCHSCSMPADPLIHSRALW